MMKLIIAGSRTFVNYEYLSDKIHEYLISSINGEVEIVSGGAIGTDRLGERFAKENNIALKIFPADWNLHGKSAGYIRNKQMAEYATDCICFWDGVSKGTKMMIDLAFKHELNVTIYNFKNKK